jgi:hypothetical protein
MESTGYILAAAGIVVANEIIFVPVTEHKPVLSDFNWRIVPATALAALMVGGLEKLSPPLGKGIAILALLSVFLVPLGNAPTPIENAVKFLGV